MHFGELIRALRIARGLSQRDLAERAGLQYMTISRFEKSAVKMGQPATLFRIYKALNEGPAPLSSDEARDYCTAAGLSEQLWKLGTFHVAPAADDVIRAAGSLDEASARAVRRFIDLVRRHGAHRVAPAIDALAASLDAHTPTPAPRTLSVVSPPRQREGYVEQEIVDYEAPAPHKPASRDVPAARRAKRKSG